ncbi:type I-E CRISPR-associated protein Cas6/Cse3/CasE [Pelomonas sp. UHG3]|uniref:Type I-E CRISPR-associated protein Cas6/Cse3/CasE n=1 Tax=Roseateles hydrophilus TaxID=2975054 RepID=A0ACC6CDC9_9BURK|nr:type I-E CRISPR-associated protein Cas6/Cse3/CasE [Pelomonas sp. UHG3]MCY4746452.1 type I-E CRISPR-associated protein Cas6/Cse3/CasE [Pelomonas sp. UHG3]
MDHIITKPAALTGYAVHRAVAGLLDGKAAQFVDRGDHLVVRVAEPLEGATPVPLREFSVGSILGFTLRASTGAKVKGRHRYWPTNDWRSRHAWLDRKAALHGFEVISVHCTARMALIEASGRRFSIDQTDFTGVLKVLDVERFGEALSQGVGSTGKAFGMGMLCL